MNQPDTHHMDVRQLNESHIGKRVLGCPGIEGWQDHLVLSHIQRNQQSAELSFRWDDDPSPSNTKRGQFAYGLTMHDSERVAVQDAPVFETPETEKPANVSDAPDWLVERVGELSRLMTSSPRSVADGIWAEFRTRGLLP